MLKNKLLPVALLALSHTIASAQTPSAGSQIRQIPPSPVPQQTAPPIRVEQADARAAAGADQVKIDVASLRVTGARAYPEAALLALTGFKPGSKLTLTELRAMAAKIEQEYRRNGYFVAQAYLPAQDIRNGALTIAVLEGQYGQVRVDNRSAVSSALVGGLLGGLNSGDVPASRSNGLPLLSTCPASA
jgi:hemolysin activation/secretion protein